MTNVLNRNESRFADSSEIKIDSTIECINIEDKFCSYGGLPIYAEGQNVYIDKSDTHTMVWGSTGSKKTRNIVMPLIHNLTMGKESIISTDPKGELYKKTSGFAAKKGYDIFVLNFRDIDQSDYWNPLELPYKLYHEGKVDEANELINDFVTLLAEPQRKNTKDIYFIDLASTQLLANLMFFIHTAKPEEVNIYNFAHFFINNSTIDQTKKIANCMTDGSVAYLNLKMVLTNAAAEKTFANVTSCVMVMLSPFIIRRKLCNVLSKSTFDIKDIGNKKTIIYIIVPDEKTTLHFLVTTFIKQTYENLIYQAQFNKKNNLPIRVNFVLDEFCNIPKISDMPTMISAARSRNIRFYLMVQSQWQLRQKYCNDAETIKGNCDNWVFLTSRELDLLREISELCGDTVYIDSNGNIQSKPLISISELQRLKKECGEALILHGRNYPFVTKLPDIDEYGFQSYPYIKRADKQFTITNLYDTDKVLDEIINRKRTLPFSKEVFGKETFYEKPNYPEYKKDDLDW